MNDPKTVRVRIAVAVDAKGAWHACGWNGANDDVVMDSCLDAVEPGESRWFVEADVPLPLTPQTVEAVSVTPAEEG